MCDASSPFTPPSHVSGVPLSYHNEVVQQQQQQEERQQQQLSHGKVQPQGQEAPPSGPQVIRRPCIRVRDTRASLSGPAPLPFSYRGRCTMYSLVLALSILCIIFAIVMLDSQIYMTVSQSIVNVGPDGLSNGTTIRDTMVLTMNGGNTKGEPGTEWETLAAHLDPAHQRNVTTDKYVNGPAGVRAAGIVTIVVLVANIFLSAICAVVLGILGCQRRRAEGEVADAAAAAQQETQRQLEEAAASGALVYVIAYDPLATAAAPSAQQGVVVRDAKTRQALGVTCLILSGICLIFTILSLACGVAAESDVRSVATEVQLNYSTQLAATTCSKALQSSSVWGNIPNFILFATTTALVSVPYLSGIADGAAAAAAGGKAAEAAAAGDALVTSVDGPTHAAADAMAPTVVAHAREGEEMDSHPTFRLSFDDNTYDSVVNEGAFTVPKCV